MSKFFTKQEHTDIRTALINRNINGWDLEIQEIYVGQKRIDKPLYYTGTINIVRSNVSLKINIADNDDHIQTILSAIENGYFD